MALDTRGPDPIFMREEVIECIAEWVACRKSKSEIKNRIRADFRACNLPEPSIPTLEAMITAAKNLLKSRIDATLNEHLSSSLGFYESVVRDENSTTEQKLRAQERIDELMGLSAKYRNTGEASAQEKAAMLRNFLEAANGSVSEPDGDAGAVD